MKRKKSSLIALLIIQVFLLGFAIFVFLVPLANRNVNFERLYNEETGIFVNNILNAINNNNLISMVTKFVEMNTDIEEGLKALDLFFENNNIESIKLINCSFNIFSSNNIRTRTTSFIYEIKFEHGFGKLSIDVIEENNSLNIKSIWLNSLDRPTEETSDFYGQTLFGTRINLLIFIIILFGFIMYTQYDYYKNTLDPKIWMQIVMLITVFSININWTSLVLDIKLLSISIFPISIFSSGIAGDWQLTYHLPIMAILYWIIFRKKEIIKKIEFQKSLTPEHVV